MKTKLSATSKTLSPSLILFLLIQLITGIFLFVPKPQEAKADGTSWYNSGWLYRKPITVDNTSNGNTLTDYQVKVSLSASNFDFSKVQLLGEDIRFTDSDGITPLNYWIESYLPTARNVSIWVKVPSIPALSAKTIYMYYGNSSYTNTIYQTYHVSVDSTAHNNYGLSYPATYEFLLPVNSSGLKAYKRYSTSDAWTQLTKKTSNDFFNGIEAVRFDYTEKRAYVSVAFGADTDDIYIKITDSNDNPINFSFVGVSKYYDSRDAAVTVTGDDWDNDQNGNFIAAANVLTSAQIWFSPAIITSSTLTSAATWNSIQNKINAGYVDPCSHSRTHSNIPYGDYDSEIGGSQSDIINNLDLPAFNKKGSQEYLTCWIEPYGACSSAIRTKLGEYHYLSDREVNLDSSNNDFEVWDDYSGLYKRQGHAYQLDDGSLTDANNKFDSVVSAGGIYLIYMHPGQVNWTDGSWERQHIDYIKEKKNLWYAGLAHLYLYHYIQDKVVVTGFTHLGDLDNTFTKDTSTTSLAMALHMDEGSGNTINDSSGNGYNGTKYGSTTWAGVDGGTIGNNTDVYFSAGNSLDFNGVAADYVNTADLSWSTTSPFTISVWIKPDDLTGLHTIISKQSYEYTLFTSGSILYFYYYETQQGLSTIKVEGTFRDCWSLRVGHWYHIVITYNGSNLAKMYVNGDAGTSDTSITGPFYNQNQVMKIGAGYTYASQTDYFDGAIDEVRIYNRALSQAEVTALYERRKYTSPEPTLTVGSEDGYPIAPTIIAPTVLSSSSIRWNFTDNSSYETGFRVYANADAIATSSATANLTYLDETGLSENTQYTRYVKAYNSYGESSSSSATSTYTLINAPTGFSFDTVGTSSITVSASGTLSNLASSTSGVYFNETSGNSGGSDSSWQQTTSYQDTGLSENTQYTYRVKARNGDSAETSYTATSSKYTLADTPTGFNFMRHPNSLDIYVDSLPNSNSGSSGYLFWRTDNSSYNSGWIQKNEWQDPNMMQGVTYTYAVKYRNGDGVETATTTMGGVSFVRDNGGGGTPTIQPQTTSTSSQQATTTSATSTQISTTTTQQTSTSTIQNLSGLTGQARQAAIQQIKAQIFEIQKKLIVLISQLIQLLQEQLIQL